MGHRLSKIVTRTGDAGTTGLGDGSRVPKNSARIESIGAVDELNSCVGVILVETLPGDVRELLTDVQHDLFDLGGELSIPGHTAIAQSHIDRLEAAVEHYNAELPMLMSRSPKPARLAPTSSSSPRPRPAARKRPSRTINRSREAWWRSFATAAMPWTTSSQGRRPSFCTARSPTAS